MDAKDVDRSADLHYREMSRLTQLSQRAGGDGAMAATERIVTAARWRLLLGRSLIRIGTRLTTAPVPPSTGL